MPHPSSDSICRTQSAPSRTWAVTNYQSTSFHDALYVRSLLGLRPAPEFESWLAAAGITDAAGRLRSSPPDRIIGALPAFGGLSR
jgi:ethanolamine ammonia-lyase large subunit